MKLYFAHCQLCGFEFFDTPEEAKAYAEDAITHQIEYAADTDWHYTHNPQDICWGEVTGRAVVTERPLTPEEQADQPEAEFITEIDLTDLSKIPE